MEERVSGRTRNFVVYGLFLFVIIGITISLVTGSKQEEQYRSESQIYETAKKKMQEKKFTEAEKQIGQLLSLHPDSYVLQWQYALILSQQKKYEEASKYFVKAQKQRPFLVRNQQYLMQFGEVLYHQGNYARAKRYFEEGKRINTDPKLSAMVDPLLNDINNKLGKKQ
jgi:predicted Zn-dependent protease